MSNDSQTCGKCYPTVIEGKTFLICTERAYEEHSKKLSDNWRAWSFFAYDRHMNVFPADAVPAGACAQESIAGEAGESEDAAREAVENRLRDVIRTRKLDGTGFYSPPGDFVYPQELPEEDRGRGQK